MIAQPYSTPPYIASQDFSSRKRKRQCDNEEVTSPINFSEYEHISKKQRDEAVVVIPLTPSSPASPPSSFQRFSSTPLFEHDNRFTYTDKSLITQPSQNLSKPPPSEIQIPVPSQNMLLHNLHLQSRAYQIQQHRLRSEDEDEEMWEEEEEAVAERYSAMNKLLGSRKPTW